MKTMDKMKAGIESYKRGNIGVWGLVALAVGLVVATLTLGFGAQITSSIQSTMTTNSAAYNATGNGLTGLTNMSSQFGNIGLIAAAVVIIGLLVGGFAVYGGMGNRQ